MSHYSCPECSGSTTVIETRLSHSRLRRRRKCPNGHRFSTLELPHDTTTKVIELITWLTKQNLDSETADYARSQIGSIMLGIPAEE